MNRKLSLEPDTTRALSHRGASTDGERNTARCQNNAAHADHVQRASWSEAWPNDS
jgi:hypothetical protein